MLRVARQQPHGDEDKMATSIQGGVGLGSDLRTVDRAGASSQTSCTLLNSGKEEERIFNCREFLTLL